MAGSAPRELGGSGLLEPLGQAFQFLEQLFVLGPVERSLGLLDAFQGLFEGEGAGGLFADGEADGFQEPAGGAVGEIEGVRGLGALEGDAHPVYLHRGLQEQSHVVLGPGPEPAAWQQARLPSRGFALKPRTQRALAVKDEF